MATLNDKNVGDVVKIKENDELVDFIIVHKGNPSSLYDSSCDGIWLLRVQAHSERAADADNNNDYENSDIKAWLDGEYYNSIDSKIRAVIKQVKIPFKKGDGTEATGVQSGSSGLSCKVFLLSGYEVGFTQTDSTGFPVDGARLSYFLNGNSDTAAKEKRICKQANGSTAIWWLRSPYLSNAVYMWIVNASGGQQYSNANTKTRWARPAFVLPSNLLVNSDGTIVTNTAPTITIDKTGNLGTLTSGFSVKYSVNDVDTNNTLTVKEYLDGTQKKSFTASRNTNYTIDYTGSNWTSLAKSSHTIKVEVSDGTETVSESITFTRGNAKPSITVTNVKVEGASWNGSDDLGALTKGLVLNYTVDDPDTNDTLTVTEYLDGIQKKSFTAVRGSSYTMDYTNEAWWGLSKQAHTIKITCSDGTDTVTKTVSFTRKNSVPYFMGIFDGYNLGTIRDGFNETYTIEDWDYRDYITVTEYINSDVFRTYSMPQGTPQQFTLKRTDLAWPGNGTHTATVSATDGTDTITATMTFTIDNHAPEITFDKSGDLGELTDGFDITYSISDADDDEVSVTERLDDRVLRSYTATLGKQESYRIAGSEWTTLALGRHAFKITASDGLETAERSIIFTRKNRPPVITTASEDLGVLTSGVNITYSVNDPDGDTVTVTETLDSTNRVRQYTAIPDKQEEYSLTGNDWLKLVNGVHTLTITANDSIDTVNKVISFERLNHPPVISSSTSEDMGIVSDGLNLAYTITDEDNDTVTATETFDDNQVRQYTVNLGSTESYSIVGHEWLKIPNGLHTFKVSANDVQQTIEKTFSFTRKQESLYVSLITPKISEENIIACTLNVTGSIPSDAILRYEVTNTATEDLPIWEDCTQESLSHKTHIFQSKGKAFNFRVSISRGESGQGGYITEITGGYE